ncbi:MerR family transcriptional regulator [Amycolatopsis methanolica]|uniref:MerR family transcriptional regulator n=1 Tax=Amycolatopsis methanolica TaxID=1814 RepID=UPI00069110A4|nr:MerR family transcriptional regulator [Amycolatopsis methanolica]
MLTISAFARLAGLTPSTLRFYDDCGVLTPARVDGATGYRYYREDQVERAVRLRELRAEGLPLAQVTTVLDGPSTEARRCWRRTGGGCGRTSAPRRRRSGVCCRARCGSPVSTWRARSGRSPPPRARRWTSC